jgi:DNA-binding winged helix-turn-helix (wHTH) protein
MLRVGAWCVDPVRGQISREGQIVRLEGRTMRLLLRLAERAGEIVSIDDLLDNVWPGVVVTPDSVYQAVASLRRQLGDDPKQPAYIVTVPRLGYRMVATVSRWADEPTALAVNLPAAPAGSQTTVDDSPSTHPWKTGALLATGVALSLALVGAFLFHGKGPNQGATAIAAVAPQARISVAVR